ncbi:MFS general substrate transporter [Punctularia strigosozonata HHB-11173 SS5]|uniref:MFS general substrate transporter n=1 Tax=Punctularia strigosozonata (strain HHB-11173) TaxID=741275 RepID=R7S484_PUNST|nr:MFS general substrate transporter [Punctularia strigosozonata HHB-11173 SS5]EIN05190.1 MFS general substrate transporter [Punctularia strigosozonata HHB-11173 SS5]
MAASSWEFNAAVTPRLLADKLSKNYMEAGQGTPGLAREYRQVCLQISQDASPRQYNTEARGPMDKANIELIDTTPVGEQQDGPPAVENEVRTLDPLPSDDPKDPLNWPLWLKIAILVQVSILAALGSLNVAIINPAYVPLAEEFGIDVVVASYQTTIPIAINGIGPFIWVPLANAYGRRPVYLFTTVLGFCSALGCAYTKNFSQLLVARVFNGLFPAAQTLGAVTVVDLFFLHQRGRAMGFWAVMLTNGSHLAPIIGGLLGQFLGWRWCFKFAAIFNAFMLLTITLCLPETLYVRQPSSKAQDEARQHPGPLTWKVYISCLRPWSRYPGKHLRLDAFVVPSLKMARYPSVLFPAVYYGVQYGFASILPAVTVAAIFKARFNFTVLQTGLAYGLALLIGGCLGELAAGMVVDAIVKREMKKRPDGQVYAEVRLHAIWTGAILVPVGLLIYGFCIANAGVHWAGALMGMGIACFGIQVITTTCYTYSIDCYKTQASEISQLFNVLRQEFGMTFAFYAVDLGNRIGYQFEFLMFALLGLVVFVPVVALMFNGARWRARLQE